VTIVVTVPFTLAFCFVPIVCRAARVALALAAATTFFSGVRGAGALRGFSPNSASVSIEPANITSSCCFTPETSVLVDARSPAFAFTAVCQVALVD
jgi:hypothetical protein